MGTTSIIGTKNRKGQVCAEVDFQNDHRSDAAGLPQSCSDDLIQERERSDKAQAEERRREDRARTRERFQKRLIAEALLEHERKKRTAICSMNETRSTWRPNGTRPSYRTSAVPMTSPKRPW